MQQTSIWTDADANPIVAVPTAADRPERCVRRGPTKQVQWKAFLRKNKLDALDLTDVVRYVRERALNCGFVGA